MNRLRIRTPPLGCWLILATFVLVGSILKLETNSSLLSQGVTTRAVVRSLGTDFCGRPSSSQLATGGVESFTVQFSDQSGHEHTGIISQCEYSGFNATAGESVTIVYDPDDLNTFAPLSALKASTTIWPIYTSVVGLVTLVLLFFWIRKRRMRKAGRGEVQAP
jgi:hypothetical protein